VVKGLSLPHTLKATSHLDQVVLGTTLQITLVGPCPVEGSQMEGNQTAEEALLVEDCQVPGDLLEDQ
jgi:hypothetical protein